METTARAQAAAEVRAAVARHGIGIGELADAVGMNRDVLGRKLGGVSPLGIEELVLIARALDVPPSTLVNAALLAAAA